MPKLEVLIAAQGIRNQEELPPVAKQVLTQGSEGLMINQTKDGPRFESPSENLRILHFSEKGISKSRNRALENARGEILLFTDEDVELLDGFSETIIQAFDNHPEADLITFQCLNQRREKRKKYPKEGLRHTLRTLMRVSSVEIAVRRQSLVRNPLFFDERFGLGGPFPTGSETAFLGDALRHGFKMMYHPAPIVLHPDDSSGRALFRNQTLLEAKGALFYRIFAWKAYAVCVLFALKKRRETGLTLLQSTKMMLSGIEQFKASGHDE
jgi:glycosyltransferase involved in cell wall biosynthesis